MKKISLDIFLGGEELKFLVAPPSAAASAIFFIMPWAAAGAMINIDRGSKTWEALYFGCHTPSKEQSLYAVKWRAGW